jgi:hypothetical protein
MNQKTLFYIALTFVAFAIMNRAQTTLRSKAVMISAPAARPAPAKKKKGGLFGKLGKLVKPIANSYGIPMDNNNLYALNDETSVV